MQRVGITNVMGRIAALAVFLIGTGLAPLADARLEARSNTQSVHIEGQSDQACPPSHDHAKCGLCVSLRAAALAAPAIPALPFVAPGPSSPVVADFGVASLLSRATQHSRAPPLS
jgi:hypothetical protein